MNPTVETDFAAEMHVPLIFTDSAASKVKELIEEEGNNDLKLRLFVAEAAVPASSMALRSTN
jgi:iron-sulfur cluster insertion protein